MRYELLLLSGLAAAALAMLIDSARRAAPSDVGDELVSGSPSATLELLERARARLDEHAPRVLFAVGSAGVLAALAVHVLSPEVAAVLGAAGAGLALPGALWIADVRRERRALERRITKVREHLSSSGLRRAVRGAQSPGSEVSRAAVPLPRS